MISTQLINLLHIYACTHTSIFKELKLMCTNKLVYVNKQASFNTRQLDMSIALLAELKQLHFYYTE